MLWIFKIWLTFLDSFDIIDVNNFNSEIYYSLKFGFLKRTLKKCSFSTSSFDLLSLSPPHSHFEERKISVMMWHVLNFNHMVLTCKEQFIISVRYAISHFSWHPSIEGLTCQWERETWELKSMYFWVDKMWLLKKDL